MTTIRESWLLEGDRADFMRAAGDAGAPELAAVLYDAWSRIPTRARRRLRGRFSLLLRAGTGASIGVPVSSAAVGVPVITLGLDDTDVGLALAHELAHLSLGHVAQALARGPARAMLLVGHDVRADMAGVLVATGAWRRRELTDVELRRERAAWRQVARWGFAVPDAWEDVSE